MRRRGSKYHKRNYSDTCCSLIIFFGFIEINFSLLTEFLFRGRDENYERDYLMIWLMWMKMLATCVGGNIFCLRLCWTFFVGLCWTFWNYVGVRKAMLNYFILYWTI